VKTATCANCHRLLPRRKLLQDRLVCRDKEDCAKATAAWIEREPFPKGVAAGRRW
jgi:hypothetical protein